MSDPRTESHAARAGASGHGQVRAEDDHVPSLPILAVGIAALLVFFVASWVVLSYLSGREKDRPYPPTPPEIGQSKIGLVEQQLFESSTRGIRDREARRKQLGSYGWVDQKAGVVRIPIDRAMELSAQGVRPRAGAPGAPAPEAQP